MVNVKVMARVKRVSVRNAVGATSVYCSVSNYIYVGSSLVISTKFCKHFGIVFSSTPVVCGTNWK